MPFLSSLIFKSLSHWLIVFSSFICLSLSLCLGIFIDQLFNSVCALQICLPCFNSLSNTSMNPSISVCPCLCIWVLSHSASDYLPHSMSVSHSLFSLHVFSDWFCHIHCIWVCMYVYVYICMFVSICMWLYVWLFLFRYMHINMYVCMFACDIYSTFRSDE